ncbi:hypothetical protein [Serratia marcescens]|uniref:hypothetical protein n=1 Tax=Serratia marcescens TaxID=615 RepID=UPI0013DAC0EE|nr:hypothetical protein [Serratia marcescens]
MANFLKKKLFVVEFCSIDPNGDIATAECLAETYTQSQAQSLVISSARKSGFTRIRDVRARLATEQEIKRAIAAMDNETNGIPPKTKIH